MAKSGIPLLTAALMAAMSAAIVAQITPACTNVLVSLAPCLGYITGNSSTPTVGCCAQLASVVGSQPRCLCQAIGGGAAAALGVSINGTQALELPAACDVHTPPVSRCNATATPSGSPTSPNTPSSENSGSTSSTRGSKQGAMTKGILFAMLILVSSYARDLISAM